MLVNNTVHFWCKVILYPILGDKTSRKKGQILMKLLYSPQEHEYMSASCPEVKSLLIKIVHYHLGYYGMRHRICSSSKVLIFQPDSFE